jgi:6-pyruvoyltetrahydropterin/6-carboxytetrahydropterin synthase
VELEMTEKYSVRIGKDYLVFSAAHFITYDGDQCERLHGHNYRVAAEVEGPLDENHYVVDFILLRSTLKAIVDEWDHHVLLPTEHALIHVSAEENSVTAQFQDRKWVFPRQDCLLLPVANTTTELLARHIGARLLEELRKRTAARISALRVEVDECFGQIGACEFAVADASRPA